MLIKHLSRGRGSATAAADYLTQDHDHTGQLRPEVEVLRGDPHQVAAVADSLDTKWKYSAAVIAWHPSDNPTSEQILAVVDDYERVAFAGMEPDRYSFSAVMHREQGGGVHVHTLVARVDLQTGKSYNPAPPGHQKNYDLVRDYHNQAHGWKSPDDSANARERSLDRLELRGKPNEDKTALHSWIMNRIDVGMIEGRDDIRASLQELGTITREGKDYISVKPEGADKAIRLKGTVYGEQFSAATSAKAAARDRISQPVGQQELADLGAELSRTVEKRAQYNRDRYGAGYGQYAPADPQCHQPDSERHQAGSSAERSSTGEFDSRREAGSESHAVGMDQADSGSYSSLADHLRKSLGADSVLEPPAPTDTQPAPTDQGSHPSSGWGKDVHSATQRGADSDPAGRTHSRPTDEVAPRPSKKKKTTEVDWKEWGRDVAMAWGDLKEAFREALKEAKKEWKERKGNDNTGSSVDKAFDSAERSIGAIDKSNSVTRQAEHSAGQADRAVERAARKGDPDQRGFHKGLDRLGDECRKIDQGLKQINQQQVGIQMRPG